MKDRSSKQFVRIMLIFLTAGLLFQCSGSRYIEVSQVKEYQSVKLYLRGGEIYDGILLSANDSQVIFVSQEDHQEKTIPVNDIRRIERSDRYYDFQAYPISDAEVEKYKNNRNTWGYALGGAVVGGLAGLAVGYPIWLANDNPPPFFVAGLGAVVGSIYFATRGIKKDRQIAVQQVRYLRSRERELEAEKQTEEARLKQLQLEKEQILKKLEEKKKKEKDPHKKQDHSR